VNPLLTLALTPNYLRHPQWRWSVASRCLTDPSLSVEQALRASHAGKDRWLAEACSFYSKRNAVAVDDPSCMLQHPVMFEAFLLHADCKEEGGFRWLLEALLMTGESYDKIASVFNPLHGPAVVEMYQKVYFDVSYYLKNRACTFCTILAASIRESDPNYDADVTWKMLAYDRGFDAFLELIKFKTGGRMPDHLIEYMNQVSSHRRVYNEYHITQSLRSSMREEAAQIAEQADRRRKADQGDLQMTVDKVPADMYRSVSTAIEGLFQSSDIDRSVDLNKGRKTEPGLNVNFRSDAALEARVFGTRT
jgi:hypothetical protein